MRLAVYVLSGLCLSACSWQSGGFGASGSGNYMSGGRYSGGMPAGGQYMAGGPAGPAPCAPAESLAPIALGCAPVPQAAYQPSFATGSYGTQLGAAATVGTAYVSAEPQLRKPRLRGTLSFGSDLGLSGTAIEAGAAKNNGFIAAYNPNQFTEAVTTGSVTAGQIQTTTYSVENAEIKSKSISWDDIYPNPWHFSAGAEYIVNPGLTFFANGGYSVAVGSDDGGVEVQGDLVKTVTAQSYDDTGAAIGPAVTNATVFRDASVSNYLYDFSDMRRYNFEVGARHYFNPLYTDGTYKTVTPFIGGAVGAAHYNDLTAKIEQNQLSLARAYESGMTELNYYDVDGVSGTTTIYDSQWVPTGNLTAGIEWQATPRTAFALESGIQVEGAREFSSGDKGDSNITVPLTLRGSFNF